jgi:hypothetical protein
MVCGVILKFLNSGNVPIILREMLITNDVYELFVNTINYTLPM